MYPGTQPGGATQHIDRPIANSHDASGPVRSSPQRFNIGDDDDWEKSAMDDAVCAIGTDNNNIHNDSPLSDSGHGVRGTSMDDKGIMFVDTQGATLEIGDANSSASDWVLYMDPETLNPWWWCEKTQQARHENPHAL